MYPKSFKVTAKISLLIFWILSACNPAVIPAAPVEVLTTPTLEATQPPTSAPEEATQSPTSTPEEAVGPYYLSLATKLDVAPQTIGAVTAVIDWAYVDESRVALHYTVSGLDWPDETPWDAMTVRITSPAIQDLDLGYGGGSWNSMPAQHGVITGSSDLLFVADALDADKHPDINLNVDIPIEGPSTVGTFHFKFNVSVLNGIKMDDLDQTVLANDVSMTLKTLVLNPSRAEALICFQMPSEMDWGLTDSKIAVGNREYPFSGGGLLAGTDGKNFSLTDPERCSTIGFDIAYDEAVTSVTLTVPRLLASTPEVMEKERVERANQRLADKGIEFDYENIDHGGNIVILKQPEGMTTDKIYPLIWDALADQYEGPWVFTVAVKQ